MVRRICCGLLFLWIAAAVVGASRDMNTHNGTMFATELAAAVVCGALGLIGLVIALGIGAKKSDRL
jgi:F0F1-type ATP synthase membrane subunit c/vacuolar-type H+-ATPase subunit K